MKMVKSLIVAAAAIAALSFAETPVYAASARMCAPVRSGAAITSRVTNPNTSTSYNLDGRGCALMSPLDTGYFAAQGFINDPRVLIGYQVIKNTNIGSLPAGAYIDSITVQETSGAAITGGIDIGTATGGQQIVAAGTCGASCLISIPDVSMLARVFSSTAPTAIWVQAHTNFTDAPAINVTIHYSFF